MIILKDLQDALKRIVSITDGEMDAIAAECGRIAKAALKGKKI